MSKSLLIIFVKVPEIGKVKTRLAESIGDIRALEIYHQLLAHTAAITQVLAYDKIVYYTPEIQHDDIWGEVHFLKARQPEGDLGKKMQHAFEEGFAAGYEQVCLIGSDCYQLSSQIIEQAFEALSAQDVVIGPATDGGYYLLGMKKMHEALFRNKKWSTDSVLKDTIADLSTAQLACFLLPELTDVDTEEDLSSMQT
ncbi:MAG: TIGR04282 family arsenosugar biosynthesis glycosyltransferase [Cyclobacteriaceae bacterium]